MGHIKSEKLDNGMVGLEITYGGPEAPFGGVDSEAPPQYIAPNCFVDAGNFGIFSQRLIAMGWTNYGVTLGSWPSNAVPLDQGTMCIYGTYYNWYLCYTTSSGVGSPAVTDTTFYIWVWPAGTTGAIALTTSCVVRQYDVAIPAVSAQATIVVTGDAATAGGTIAITVGGGATLHATVNIGDNAATVAASIAAAITAAVGYSCTAIVDTGFTNQVDLTATTPGSAANNMSIILGVTIGGGGTIPLPAVFQGFNGGIDAYSTGVGVSPFTNKTSWVQVGEKLYISGFGNLILEFGINAPVGTSSLLSPTLVPISQYLGTHVLAKFNNQLIAVGIDPGPGVVIDAPEMVIGWSAPGEFGVWNPEYSDGTVTGAGFNEITDISDYLTGLLIGPGTAIILRTQGVDYITPLGGGVVPFDFQHISNALKGEGCQDPRWVTQYDRVGFFLGNSDVYQFSGGLDAIGAKIKNVLISEAAAQGTSQCKDSTCGCFAIQSDTNTAVFFLTGPNVYMFGPQSKSWMPLPMSGLTGTYAFLEMLCTNAPSTFSRPAIASYDPILSATGFTANPPPPNFYLLGAGIQNVDFIYRTQTFILFKQEEVAFGRDITIESLLINAAGSPGVSMTWSVNGVISGTLVLPGTASPSVFQNYQVFFTANSGDVTTVQNPQLRLDVPMGLTGTTNQLSISKIALFGSFDPSQRPV